MPEEFGTARAGARGQREDLARTLGLAGIDVVSVRQVCVVQRLKRKRTEYKKGCCM